MIRLLFFLLLATALPTFAARERPETPEAIATNPPLLLDPVKVATLKGDRPANQRLYKILHWLEVARQRGGDVPAIVKHPPKRQRAMTGRQRPERTNKRLSGAGQSWRSSGASPRQDSMNSGMEVVRQSPREITPAKACA